MSFLNNKLGFILGGALAAFAVSASAAAPHSTPKTFIKHIESHGTYAVVSLSKDIDNINGCPGSAEYPLPTSKVRQFYISIDDQRNNYVLIMTVAAAKKRAQFLTTRCEAATGLPVIDSVDALF